MKPTTTHKLICVIVILICSSFANEKMTKSFVIKGKIKEEKTIAIEDLQKLTLHTIGAVTITSHKGEAKGKARHMKGILLKDILQTVTLDADSPKLFSEYYFVCVGSDGYKVVYSWNELFNTAVSEKVFIVMEKDGKNMTEDEDGILMISSDDYRTGRRFLKNLETIRVERVN